MINYNRILSVIDSLVKDKQAKSIINSLDKTQIESKTWLVEKLKPFLHLYENPKICVAAGWYGLTANLLSDFTKEKIVSFDKDSKCREYGYKMYGSKIELKTEDMKDFNISKYDVIICTSCEHISDNLLNNFLSNKKSDSLVVLQSNNMIDIDDHINCKKSLDEFVSSLDINIVEKYEKKFDEYTRYMVIGR